MKMEGYVELEPSGQDLGEGGICTLQNDPEGTPSNIPETKFRLGAGDL